MQETLKNTTVVTYRHVSRIVNFAKIFLQLSCKHCVLMPLGPEIFWRCDTLDALDSQLFLLLKNSVLIIFKIVKGFFGDLGFGVTPTGACNHLFDLFLLLIIVTKFIYFIYQIIP